MKIQESTRIIRINTKIHRALERILKDHIDDPNIHTTSQLANELLDFYIRTFYTNGNDIIDRDNY